MKPIRVIEGTMEPNEPFWVIRNAAESESGEAEVEFFGPISEYSWWGDEVTPAMFKQQLYEAGNGGPVTVMVNSPGGEIVAASVIRSILQEYPGKVTADIVGMAASAATIVITGADHVRMRESAMMMIHDPSTVAWGTIDELQEVVSVLKVFKQGIVDQYQTKTGMDREKLAKMMRDATYMTAHQAKEYGFVDEVVTGSVRKATPLNMRAGFLNCLAVVGAPEGFEMDAVVDEISPSSQPSPSEGEGAEETEEVVVVITAEEETSEASDADNELEAQRLRDYVEIFG